MKSDHHNVISLAERPERYRSLLLSWFDGNRRSLPWRRHRTLYGTWISEMMLQQTTVKTVGPYWERFMAAFPDVEALASANLEEVLSLWSGLGYYRRARHLHRAARKVVESGGGKLPQDRDGWLELPGVGPYASGAIASIGLGQREPALDANARRVLTRWLIDAPQDLEALRPAHLDRIGTELVDATRPGDWNEALMELGALLCRATAPRCGGCPVNNLCRAHQAGSVDMIPRPRVAILTERVELGVLVLAWHDGVLLLPPGIGPTVVPAGSADPVRRDVSGLHRDLWGLPSTPWLPGRPTGQAVWSGKIWRTWLQTVLGLEPPAGGGDPDLLGDFSHSITRYRLAVQVYGLRLDGNPDPLWGGTQTTAHAARTGEISLHQLGEDDTRLTARFCPRRSLDRPVSNLVNKSLALAAKTMV